MELYLTVNAQGVVSLWDTPAQANRILCEAFITLQITPEQEEVIKIAHNLAYSLTNQWTVARKAAKRYKDSEDENARNGGGDK